jgi:hypothetical protein
MGIFASALTEVAKSYTFGRMMRSLRRWSPLKSRIPKSRGLRTERDSSGFP